jgi:hypothetical protein
MRIGVIIYMPGATPVDWTEEKEFVFRKTEVQADAVDFITAKTGYCDISDAWPDSIRKGMARIICKVAHLHKNGELRYTGRELRLAG